MLHVVTMFFLYYSSLFKRICVPRDDSEGIQEDEAHKKLRHQIARESIVPIKDPKTGKIVKEGIVASCGDVRCVFEFSAYQYTKARGEGKKSTVSSSQEKRQKQMKDKNRQPQQRQTMPLASNDSGQAVRLPVAGVLDLHLSQERKVDNREAEERNMTTLLHEESDPPIVPWSDTSGLRHRTVPQGDAASGAPPAKPQVDEISKQTSSHLHSATATADTSPKQTLVHVEHHGDEEESVSPKTPDGEPGELPPIEPEPMTEEEEYWFMSAKENKLHIPGGEPSAQYSTDDNGSDADKSTKSVPSMEASEHGGEALTLNSTVTNVSKQNVATSPDSLNPQEHTVINGLDHQ